MPAPSSDAPPSSRPRDSMLPSPATQTDHASPPTLSCSATSPETKTSPAPVAQDKKRKSGSRAGSRGVANLTPEQLARKRANDRQAQRAIRERVKAQIEALEQRVRELSSSQPYQDLQKAVAEKEAIKAENEEIKRRLAAVLDLIQPVVGKGVSSAENPALTVPTTAPPELTHPSPLTERNHDTPISLEFDPSCPESSVGTPSPLRPAAAIRSWPRADPLSVVRSTVNPQLASHDAGERLVLNFLVESTHNIPKICGSRRMADERPLHRVDPACVMDQPLAYMVPVRNLPPTCLLDVILLNFVHERRREVAEGLPPRQQLRMVGLPYPSVSSLLNPEQTVPRSYAISKVFTDIIRTFPDCSTLPEQIGVLYHLFLVMRWQVSPTQRNYEEMPDWLAPRPAQLFTPHPAWVDYVLWPKIRDRIVLAHRDYPFENWFIPYSRTISCNWPYDATECLLHDTESDELVINPVFERHVRELSNWSLGPAFVEAFPALVDAARIKNDDGSFLCP
ncbi:hypothetical protein VTN77DRAFT_8888 [Rasamsonia byssochlamydoides]|uniref:uncharacterized protein n=1 Tax=Rasamsonia byssochlamydoides TaxID=89139 RepID=UPI003742B923